MKECEAVYGTGQKEPQKQTAYCERTEGHPPVSADRIGHWGSGDERYETNPDLAVSAQQVDRRREEAVRDQLRNAFAEQSKIRHRYAGLDWIKAELDVMHTEVNKVRAIMGQPPVGMEAIQAAESMAAGHSDYWLKFPLYCQDVVFDRASRL